MTVNGTPKADSVQNLSSLVDYNSPHRAQNNEILAQSPVWMNSLVFNVARVSEIVSSG